MELSVCPLAASAAAMRLKACGPVHFALRPLGAIAGVGARGRLRHQRHCATQVARIDGQSAAVATALAAALVACVTRLSWVPRRNGHWRRSGHRRRLPMGLRACAGVSEARHPDAADAENSSAAEPSGGWCCVKGCGACCFLGPEDRPYLEDLLSANDLAVFRELVGPDGWCVNYDSENRVCKIYESRPVFCRVKTWLASKADGFGVDASDEASLGGFCASCCREHISGVYGKDSVEMAAFNREVTVGNDAPEDIDEKLDDAAHLGEDAPDGWDDFARTDDGEVADAAVVSEGIPDGWREVDWEDGGDENTRIAADEVGEMPASSHMDGNDAA
mmetsp:Transcript_11612/g.31104  ORF Transcript_11612/g.31104 Transcript_11612/m.31104 type:complete len:333 (-) Transcript_11612:81-1079(-)|eukprot:CAMPEP_0117576572 /NCGR_PEP_ID=MMETSP0784-20121206/62883_1 /TAXON_ID=39447 /ORGANISM="" /LENGTH=332 /DNA_ID=CAMNT_0005375861 /DNA_START=38 /DNA_END=1036 /DNA_ORIENTATION=-